MGKQRTEEVTLPFSGEKYVIIRPNVFQLKEILGMLPLVQSRARAQAVPEKEIDRLEDLEQAIRVVVMLTHAPKLSAEDPAPEGLVSVADLDGSDFFFLIREIKNLCGVNEAAQQVNPS